MQVKQWQCNYKWRDFHCVFMFVWVWLWQVVLLNANGGVRRLAGRGQKGDRSVNNGWVNVSESSSKNLLLLKKYCWNKRTVIYLEYPKLPGPGRQGHSVIFISLEEKLFGWKICCEENVSWIIQKRILQFQCPGNLMKKSSLPSIWHSLKCHMNSSNLVITS